jgi:hypothetical protein
MKQNRPLLTFIALSALLCAHASPKAEASARLLAQVEARLKAIYETREFSMRAFAAMWLPDGSGYLKFDLASGRTIPLTKDGDPDTIENGSASWSPDGKWIAWVDMEPTANEGLEWIRGGQALVTISERDGWRRAYVVSRDGSGMKPITAPGSDLIAREQQLLSVLSYLRAFRPRGDTTNSENNQQEKT